MVDSNQQFMNQLEAMGGGKAKGEPVAEEGKIQYTSHPIKRFRIGKRWEFEDGLLTLESEEEEKEFLKIIDHKNFPPRERSRIRKLDFEAAARISEEFRKQGGRVTQQSDSTIGERADGAPKVGTGDLIADSSKPSESEAEAPAGDETSGVESSKAAKSLGSLLNKPKE
jgi:hypothetical protein